MKYLIYSITIIMGLFACDNDKNDDIHYNLDTNISLTVVNENGIDLLNPENTDAFLEENIKIYYLIDGEMEEVFDPNMDNPRNFSINEPEVTGDKYWMELSLNIASDSIELYGTTYIKWNDVDTDTIQCDYKSGSEYTIITKVLFNKKIVWEGDGLNGRYFEIVK